MKPSQVTQNAAEDLYKKLNELQWAEPGERRTDLPESAKTLIQAALLAMANTRRHAPKQRAPEQRITKKLIKRTDPRKLSPNNCCFIFGFGKEQSFFRVYHRDDGGSFTDYRIGFGVTPFVQFTDDDVELKEFRREDGSIDYVMDFPEVALTCGKTPALAPGEVWNAPPDPDDELDSPEARAWLKRAERQEIEHYDGPGSSYDEKSHDHD